MQKTITVTVRQWFDKVNGNSYQSYAVFYNGSKIAVSPFSYGFSAGFAQDKAYKLLNMHHELRSSRIQDIKVIDVVEVMRRKDLHNGGKGAEEVYNTINS